MNTFFTVVLTFNCLWFGIAFWSFSIRSARTARLLAPSRDRDENTFTVLIHSLKFLGGMNLALGVWALLLLVRPEQQSLWAALVFALAHATQFCFNVPLALRQARGERYLWPVLKGPMAVIFCIDFTLAVANGVCGVLL